MVKGRKGRKGKKGKKWVNSDIRDEGEKKIEPKGGTSGRENDPYGWLKQLAIGLDVGTDHYRTVFGEEPEVKSGNNRERR